jgi:hypothetical protein
MRAQHPKTAVPGPSFHHLFGPRFAIAKGHWSSFYQTKRFPAPGGQGVEGLDATAGP